MTCDTWLMTHDSCVGGAGAGGGTEALNIGEPAAQIRGFKRNYDLWLLLHTRGINKHSCKLLTYIPFNCFRDHILLILSYSRQKIVLRPCVSYCVWNTQTIPLILEQCGRVNKNCKTVGMFLFAWVLRAFLRIPSTLLKSKVIFKLGNPFKLIIF